MRRYGTFRGVGVGPGDPQLMTIKAVNIIRASTLIAFVVDDRGESFARHVAAEFFAPDVRELPLHFSMSPCREDRLAARAEAARQVLEILSSGQDVTFITEGDPLLYSTFQHIMTALPPEVALEICPGVSSLTATAAEASFPLAVEGQRMLVAAANPDVIHSLPGWLESFEVIILFKIHRYIKTLQEVLKEKNSLDQAILVQHASLAGQAVVKKLVDWNGETLPYFSMLLIRSTEKV